MDDQKKKKLFTIMYIVMIVVVIATCIFMMFYLSGNSASCLKDPIQYFTERSGQMCYCNSGMGWINP